jgi:hypothetical protein
MHYRPDSGILPTARRDTPRLLVCVADARRRAALTSALRDTGYEVDERPEPLASGDGLDGYDLVLQEVAEAVHGTVPTLLLPDPFEVVEVEMLVLDLLGWDGPPTVRRVPTFAITA